MGFTYIYGSFGSVFFAAVWLGLYWKKMNRLAAVLSMLVGLIAYIYCIVAGTPWGLPAFIFSVSCALVATLVGVLFGKKPELEAYEAFFEDHVSPKTLKIAHKIRRDIL
jgi:sodium/pantothenate symporter